MQHAALRSLAQARLADTAEDAGKVLQVSHVQITGTGDSLKGCRRRSQDSRVAEKLASDVRRSGGHSPTT